MGVKRKEHTASEINGFCEAILRSIDREKVRGFHPWQFSGSVALDDTTLIVATTKQWRGYVVEMRFFTDEPPRYRHRIDHLTIRLSTNSYSKEALVEAIRRLLEKEAKRDA
ncbi:MAG: hypothetical protein IJA20_02255 [Methanocorpusculum sp.]|nr:hypothetical protein [Oscillospiraceae bacterium]MBQ3569475.1 hypothetical protein [Methanocorpusculum sp.]